MKNLLTFLLLALPLAVFSQARTDTYLKTESTTEIGGKTYAPSRANTMNQDIIDSKKNHIDVWGVTGTNTYTFTTLPVAAWVDNQSFKITFPTANTTAVTINTIPLKKNVSAALVSGDICAGCTYDIIYKSASNTFQLVVPVFGSGNGIFISGTSLYWGGELNSDVLIGGGVDNKSIEFGGTSLLSNFGLWTTSSHFNMGNDATGFIYTDDQVSKSGIRYGGTGYETDPLTLTSKGYVDDLVADVVIVDGNGTTANGTAVDIGGALTGAVDTDGAYDFSYGSTNRLTSYNIRTGAGTGIYLDDFDSGVESLLVINSAESSLHYDNGSLSRQANFNSTGIALSANFTSNSTNQNLLGTSGGWSMSSTGGTQADINLLVANGAITSQVDIQPVAITLTSPKIEITGTAATVPTNASVTTKTYVLGTKSFIGKQTFLASATGAASLTIPHGAAPTSPVNGDIWTTTSGMYTRINGTTVRFILTEDGSVIIPTVGGGLQIKEGTNACMGSATLVAGTVTVSTTKVTANSRIQITAQNTSGTEYGFVRVSSRTAGTSFVITAYSGGNTTTVALGDTSLVAWEIVEPAP